MSLVAAAFWGSLFAVLYAYAGYPAVLWLLARLAGREGPAQPAQPMSLPRVTVLISAYNEEKVIGEKIANTLALDYPRNLLEIVVISDGSSDRTCEIVAAHAHEGVVLRHYEGRIGKTACLNLAVPLATGGIVVFSDANSQYGRESLGALLEPFRDEHVGFVTGWTRYGSGTAAGGGGSLGLGLYSRLELLTKELESRLGSCVGADGAIFAIRRELYRPLSAHDINDLVIPLSINLQGYRGVLQPSAICFENDAGSAKGEFHRQVRITSRTIRALMNYRQLLNPFRFGLLSFEIFSHKICKFLVPLFLLALLAANLPLASRGPLYLAALLAQGAFYAGAIAAAFVSSNAFLSRLTDAARTFVVVNAAIAVAWIKYFQGETFTTWSPTKR